MEFNEKTTGEHMEIARKEGKISGLKMAYDEFKRIFWNEKWDINFMFVLKDYGQWLEQQIQELESE